MSRTVRLGDDFRLGRRMRTALDSNGVPYVAMQAPNDVDDQVLRFDGTGFVPFGPILNTGATGPEPSIAIDAAGKVYVAFEQNLAVAGTGEVLVKSFDTATSAWQTIGTPFPLTRSGDRGFSSPRIGVDANGRPVLVFVSDGGNFGIESWRFDGTTWRSLGTFGAGFFFGFTMCLDSNGLPVVAYLQGVGGGNSARIDVVRNDGAAWIGVATSLDSVPSSLQGLSQPALALDGAGVPWIGWTKFDGDGHRIASHLVHVETTGVVDAQLPDDFRVGSVGLGFLNGDPVIVGDADSAADVRRFHLGTWEPKALTSEPSAPSFDVLPLGAEVLIGMGGQQGLGRVVRFRFPP